MSNVHTPLEEKKGVLPDGQTSSPPRDGGTAENLWLRRKAIATIAVLAGVELVAAIHGPGWVRSFREQPAPAGPGSATGERKVLYWYDPMHPAYKSDKPGIAPDCGMQLVPKYADEETNVAKMPAGTVMIALDKQQLIGVRTGKVAKQTLERTIRTTAQLTADETKIAHVHVKVSGWIDKIYVDYVGQLVQKGQPLFTLYSPDLVATQQEYLIAKRGQATLGNSPFKDVSTGS